MLTPRFKLHEAKSLFFDSKAVLKAVDRGTRKVLSKFGAFVRTRARSSMRKSKKSAPPGQPPRSHVGLLKKFLFFVYEPATRGVVIGPARLNQQIGDAPEALEKGGKSRVVSGRRGQRRVQRVVKIAPHPYMGPAFEAEKKALPAMWTNSVQP